MHIHRPYGGSGKEAPCMVRSVDPRRISRISRVWGCVRTDRADPKVPPPMLVRTEALGDGARAECRVSLTSALEEGIRRPPWMVSKQMAN
mmetsp:Transcript_73745/g.196583  ORF Transcript_73745/g.196583 Transcript_73745/m.196583 type:complete len:90 (-) Transcript_73745:919-1188(-)